MYYFISKNPLCFKHRKFIRCTILLKILGLCLLFYFILLFPKKASNASVYTDPVKIYKKNYPLKQPDATSINTDNFPVDFDPNLPELRERIVRISTAAQFPSDFINTQAVYTNRVGNKLFTNTKRGSLNVYVWRDMCSDSIDVLKSKLGFPYNPWRKSFTNSVNIYTLESSGQRIFGYIFPPISGRYNFKISYYGSVDVWISPNSLPSNAVQCELSKPNMIHQVYRMLFSKNLEVEYFTASLVAGSKQYIEIMHATSSEAVLELQWKKPQSRVYELISSQFLFPYHADSNIEIVPETYYPPPIPMHMPSAQMILLMHPKDARNSVFSLPTVDINALEEGRVFPSCVYQPAYLRNSRRESNSLDLVSTFPATPLYSLLVEPEIYSTVISISLVKTVLSMFMYHIKFSYPSSRLSRLVNMEKLPGHQNGDLFLVEALITFTQEPLKELLVSQYVVLGHRSLPLSVLCSPVATVIRRDTFIHFLVTQRNLPQMARQFVENMERIYEETGDENFGLIIVNYASTALDMVTLLRQSSLKHWSVIDVSGPWEKTAALNLGIDSVKSVNDIIFITDLSLSIPSHLPDTIRKHTFQGYAGFAPVIFYFTCEFTEGSIYKGFYSITGFGLFGMYKSDWMIVGGMNTDLYKGKWGFEDNDLATRVISAGYVVFRLVMRDFFHQNHSYAGLWDSQL